MDEQLIFKFSKKKNKTPIEKWCQRVIGKLLVLGGVDLE